MALVFWWLLIVLLVVFLGVVYVTFLRKRKKVPTDNKQHVAIANSRHYRNLPLYGQVIKRYKTYLWIALIVSCTGLLAAALLSARPAKLSTDIPEKYNRDIVLCLDVSGSMLSTDQQILKAYLEILKGFKGERVGMAIFDVTTATVFPLTDDYDAVKTQLELGVAAFDPNASYADSQRFTAGTSVGNGSSSLIGDGIASCAQRFDVKDSKRSRSIVLGTDNELGGKPIVTFGQSVDYLKKNDIRLYGINPSDYSQYTASSTAAEYRKGVLATGGAYYKLDDSDSSAANGIVSEINQQEQARMKGSPRLIVTDQPTIAFAVLSVVIVGYGIIVWRLRL